MRPIVRVKWLMQRLHAMGPAEICSRLGDVGRHAVLYATAHGVSPWLRRPAASADRLLKAPTPSICCGHVPQETRERVVAEASQWRSHRGSIFALRDIPLGDPIQWHHDYASGRTSPLKYSGLINYRDASVVGDVKYIWEINRLQHLVLLALAAVWTGQSTYTEAVIRQTLSWCTQNPFMQGLNWKSPLEAALRLISWALTSVLLRQTPQAQARLHQALYDPIYQHQYFIRMVYARHSSANNHLIGEMAGLYVASVCWPWYRQSHAWRAFARRLLLQEIMRQVEADGVGKERATEYQLFLIEFFLLAGALAQAIGEPFPTAYWQQLRSMVGFLAAVSDREGNLPMFGDGDSGQVVWLPETMQERSQTLIRLSQSHNQTVAPTATDVRSLLLLWGQTPQQVPLAAVVPEQGLHAFPQGGYYVLATDRGGDDEMMVVFDAGPLGFSPLYAHGHADALSFWLSYGGREFLIDPGTFCYHTHEVWRAYFRGTAAHNTLRIDSTDQSVPGGCFLWRQAASCQAVHVEDNEKHAVVEGFHTGYRRLADPVIHWRGLRLQKKARTLIITDRLECRGSHDVEVLFHFSEQCQVRPVGTDTFEAANGDRRLCLRLDTQLKPHLYRGSEHPITGWVSRSFGVKKPAFTLIARVRVTGPTQWRTEIAAL